MQPQRISTSRFGFAIFCVRILGFVAFFSLATASAIRAQEDRQAPRSKDLCYAFLRDHNIWTVCQGKRERIHMPYKVSGFALLADGSHLAYYTQKTSHGGKVLQRQDLMVISLEPGFEVAKHETGVVPRKLVATCGTILKSETNSLTDLLGREPSKLPQQSFFKCSSDRRVIAVWNTLLARFVWERVWDKPCRTPCKTVMSDARKCLKNQLYNISGFNNGLEVRVLPDSPSLFNLKVNGDSGGNGSGDNGGSYKFPRLMPCWEVSQ
jgi:hypothetical protein